MPSIENKSNIEQRIDPCGTSTGKNGAEKGEKFPQNREGTGTEWE